MTSAILLCAGRSTRFSVGAQNKTLYLLKGKPLFMYSIGVFKECGIDKVIIVIRKEERENFEKFTSTLGNIEFVTGGRRRQDSVANALNHLYDDEKVLIHDGARPMITKKLVERVLNKIQPQMCVVPVIPIDDALRMEKSGKLFSIDRTKVFRMQTPQGCIAGELKEFYEKFKNMYFYDDAAAFEEAGLQVKDVEGDKRNIKITTVEDIMLASFLLS